jgi:hypothetical protein
MAHTDRRRHVRFGRSIARPRATPAAPLIASDSVGCGATSSATVLTDFLESIATTPASTFFTVGDPLVSEPHPHAPAQPLGNQQPLRRRVTDEEMAEAPGGVALTIASCGRDRRRGRRACGRPASIGQVQGSRTDDRQYLAAAGASLDLPEKVRRGVRWWLPPATG